MPGTPLTYAVAYLAKGAKLADWRSFSDPTTALAFVEDRLAAHCHVTVEHAGSKIAVADLVKAAQAKPLNRKTL